MSRPSPANADAGAPVAAHAIGRPRDHSAAMVAVAAATVAIAVATMNAHRAARPDASGPVGTGGASGCVGFRNPNREKAHNQQTGNDILHCFFPQFDSEFRTKICGFFLNSNEFLPVE